MNRMGSRMLIGFLLAFITLNVQAINVTVRCPSPHDNIQVKNQKILITTSGDVERKSTDDNGNVVLNVSTNFTIYPIDPVTNDIIAGCFTEDPSPYKGGEKVIFHGIDCGDLARWNKCPLKISK